MDFLFMEKEERCRTDEADRLQARRYRTILFAFIAGGLILGLQNAAFQESLQSSGDGEHRIRVVRVTRYDEEKYKIEGILLEDRNKQEERSGIISAVNPFQKTKILFSYYHKLDRYWTLIGKEMLFYGKLERPEAAGNPHCFDYRNYLRTRGITLVCSGDQFRVCQESGGVKGKAVRKIMGLRESFLLDAGGSGRERALIRGMLFGDTHEMDEGIYEAFRKNGTAHILAVSGLHVGVLYALYRKVRRRRHSLGITCAFLGFILFYGTITLWSVSVTRAILLIILVIFGDILERRYDLLTALGLASLIILLRNPSALFGASFQMSFLAVCSISFFAPWFNRYFRPGTAAMLAVQLGTVPYMAYTFNLVPLLAVLINIPVIWFLSVIVPVGILTFLIYSAAPVLPLQGVLPSGEILTVPLKGMAEIMIRMNQIAAGDSRFSLDVPSMPLWSVILFYGVLFIASSETMQIAVMRQDIRCIAAAVFFSLLLTISAAVCMSSPFDQADFVFVDVGQGDCLHIRGHTNALIDGGGSRDYDLGKKTLKPYLLKNGITHLDLVMATHLHTDHYLGLQQLSSCYPIKKGITIGKAGEKIQIGRDCQAEILWPEVQNPDTDDENENSLIFKVRKKGVTVLVTGDLTEEGEKALLDKYRGTDVLHADILKVAHHGSKYSSCAEFLKAVSPKTAVISVGKRNTYGHPAEAAIKRLIRQGAKVYRTDQDGAVGIFIKERGYRVCCQKEKDTLE